MENEGLRHGNLPLAMLCYRVQSTNHALQVDVDLHMPKRPVTRVASNQLRRR